MVDWLIETIREITYSIHHPGRVCTRGIGQGKISFKTVV